MKYSILLAIGFVGLSNTTWAAGECANPQDQRTMTECADKAFKKSDAELNKLYRQLEARGRSDPDTTKLLVVTQRAWIAFRDAECDFSSAGATGGSINPMTVVQCRDGMTQDRIKALQSYLTCKVEDGQCPLPPS